MSLARRTVQDFVAQIAAQTPGSKSGATYVATLQADGSVQVTKNGVVLYRRVLWGMGAASAVTDANISGDSVDVYGNDGIVGSSDGQSFINNLV